MKPFTHGHETTSDQGGADAGEQSATRTASQPEPGASGGRLQPALTGRRGVLKSAGVGLGVVVGAGVVAACSSPPVQPAKTAPSPAGAAPSSPGGPGETNTGAETPAAAAGGTATSQVPVGGGTIFADTQTVVTQPTAGTFKAFDTTCPHAGCAVAAVADGKIDCPCHGSQFDITSGDAVTGPAVNGLTPKKITVSGDTFTIS